MRYRSDFEQMETSQLLAERPELVDAVESLAGFWDEFGAEWGDRYTMGAGELADLDAVLRDRGVAVMS